MIWISSVSRFDSENPCICGSTETREPMSDLVIFSESIEAMEREVEEEMIGEYW